MADLHGIKPIGWSIVGPCDVACKDSLRPLQPLETDKRRGTEMRLAELIECICKRVGFVARGCRLGALAGVTLYALPWIVCRHHGGVKPANDIPCTACNVDGEISLANTMATGTDLQLGVDLID